MDFVEETKGKGQTCMVSGTCVWTVLCFFVLFLLCSGFLYFSVVQDLLRSYFTVLYVVIHLALEVLYRS